eukprot:scaffold42595_cov30-Phaeocystis_antarctica.AAC.2
MKTTTKPTARLVHSSPMTAERALPGRYMLDDGGAWPGERELGCGRRPRGRLRPWGWGWGWGWAWAWACGRPWAWRAGAGGNAAPFRQVKARSRHFSGP